MIAIEEHKDWQEEEKRHEVNRLRRILRDSRITEEETRIATAMLEFWESEAS